MRLSSSIPIAIALVLAMSAAPAAATPVALQIEGRDRTLFEGTIDTSGHNVRATDDTPGALRQCDGKNNGANPTAGPTPTAAAYDALALSGRGFTGDWYDSFSDYLVTGFAGESNANWGLLRNGVATSRGGCQVTLTAGDRVVWSAGGAGTPITLAALSSTSASPITVRATTSSGPLAGAAIYVAAADGTPGPALAATGADGIASVAFGGGFQRLKAVKAGLIRSNRVVACASACIDVPADLGTRAALAPTAVLGTTTAPLKLSRVETGSSGYRRGLIAVQWGFARRGVGLLRWGIDADDLSTRSKRFVTREKGTTQTSALVRLPAGRAYALRFTAVDRMLNRSTVGAGEAVVPIDERSKRVRRTGRWSKAKASNAWDGTLLRGRPGARVKVKLARGRPTLLLRGGRGRATLRVTAGSTTRTIRVKAAKRGAHQFVRAFRRARAGSVTVRVVRGGVDLDGVAVSP